MVILADTRRALADEWAAASPRTPGEIAAFYRTSEGMQADLEAWHATPERQLMTRAIVAEAVARNPQRILEVGSGIGRDLSAVREALPGAEFVAVEPNEEMRAALDFETAADISQVAGDFDLVICIDVLEHLPDPEVLVSAMLSRLRPGGAIIERTATFDHDTPLHLEETHDWTPDDLLLQAGLYKRPIGFDCNAWAKDLGTPSILLCSYGALRFQEFVDCVDVLFERGWYKTHHRGDALITRARSKVVSHWYRDVRDSDVFLMLDDDVIFKAEDAERVVQIARDTRSIACGAYPVHDGGHLASRALETGTQIRFGPDLPPVEIKWAATGFMAVHRDVLDALVPTMPLCDDNAVPWWPLFDTAFIREDGAFFEDPTAAAGEQVVGLSEDYAFCERARRLGFKVWLDPQTILLHMSQTAYSVMNMPKSKVVQREV